MCRVWGISYGPEGPTSEPVSPSELAAEIFPQLVTGGPDAYGWATWDGNHIQSAKFQGKVNKRKAQRRIKAIDDDALWVMGHTRAQTHGSADHAYNNHPIVHGDVIGVHNGFIQNHDNVLRATGRQDARAEVDSEAIFALVNLLGYEGLNLIEGTMVSVWVNRHKPAMVWLARSRSSQLHLAQTVNGSAVWCTESAPLTNSSLELVEAPKRITATGVAFQVTGGQISDPLTYNPTIKEAGTYTNYNSTRTTHTSSSNRNPSYIPTLYPGRNPRGTLKQVIEASKHVEAKNPVDRRSVAAAEAIEALDEGVPISGITDYYDRQQSPSTTQERAAEQLAAGGHTRQAICQTSGPSTTHTQQGMDD